LRVIYTVASESVQDMMINERPREFCSLRLNPSIDLHSFTYALMMLHWPKRKASVRKDVLHAGEGIMRGVTKASLWQKHKQHSNTCGNESVHSLCISSPRKVNYRTISNKVLSNQTS